MTLLNPAELRKHRGRVADEVTSRVAGILEALRGEGAPALARFARDLDGVEDLTSAGPEAMAAAFAAQTEAVQRALRTARDRLYEFQVRTVPHGAAYRDASGNRLAFRVVPLRRVGICVPGGKAPYPSTLLMAAVAARAAGVQEIVACSPRAHPLVLAAGHVAGVDAVYPCGGAQAVGAMAYGIAPLPKVDKIVGPGGPHVVEAKRQVFGSVGVESLPGPSELVVVADGSADPSWVRADLLAQAEHGHEALILLITPSRELAEAVNTDTVVTDDLESAVALADELAPEHLSLQCRGAANLALRVRNAGLVCIGPFAPVAAADYAVGTNHVLPTEGTARFSSALSAADFCKRVQVWEADANSPAAWAEAATLAHAEGFAAHAASVRLRLAAAVGAAPVTSRSYVPQPPAGAALLDLNENPHPWPAEAMEDAVARIRVSPPNRYPRAEGERLVRALAQYAGVSPDHVVVANGADELIAATVTSLLPRIRRVVFPTPTFGMYRRAAEALGIEAVGVPLRGDWSLDTGAVARATAGPGETLLFLCRPNNPTGNVWPRAQVLKLCDLPGVWSVIDEAYWEFAGENLTPALAGGRQILLLRTMSKAFGCAGLRVGYALGAGGGLTARGAVPQPWSVGRFDQAGAEAALAAEVNKSVVPIVAERRRLLAALGELAYPSATNFILFRAPGAYERLLAMGVAVRRYPDPALVGCLRVSVGTPAENDRFLAALKEVLA